MVDSQLYSSRDWTGKESTTNVMTLGISAPVSDIRRRRLGAPYVLAAMRYSGELRTQYKM